MMQGGPQAVSNKDSTPWRTVLTQRMKDKFMQLFGTSWVMPLDMLMEYTYQENVSIRISLTQNYEDLHKNYIQIEFSQELEDYFKELSNQSFSNITPGQKEHAEKTLNKLFNDP